MPKKSHCMTIGPDCISNMPNLSVSGSSIMWVDSLSYLGIRIIACKKFKADHTACRRKCFADVNCIYSSCVDDLDKLFLMETHYLPILMYALEAMYFDATRCNEINSWWNSVYRKIFHFNKWESVSELILFLERLDYKSLYMLRKCKFIKSMSGSDNTILSYIMPFHLRSEEFMCFCGRSSLNIRMSVPKIKHILINRMHIKVVNSQ